MLKTTTKLTLNLQLPNTAVVCYAVQQDKASRFVEATILDGGTAWTPPAGTLYTIRYRKADGTGGFYDTMEDNTTQAVTFSGNVATICYAQQLLAIAGDVLVQLEFYSATGEILTSFSWIVRVQPNVWADDEIVSSDYYNVLSEQMAAVLDAATSLTGMTASATGLGTGVPPTVTVTGGSGGVPYNLAFGIPAGPTGPAPTITATEIAYQASTSGTVVPTGEWTTDSVPAVSPGQYLWTRVTITFSSGAVSPYYSVAYRGLNGNGAVNSVNGQDPDSAGDVTLTASSILYTEDPAQTVADELGLLDSNLATAMDDISDLQTAVAGITAESLGVVSYDTTQTLTTAQQTQARSNIGMASYLVRQTYSQKISGNVAAGGATNTTVALSRTGYTAVAIVGWNTGSTSLLLPRINLNAAGTSCTIVVRNVSSAAISSPTIYFDVLWMKN